MLATTENMADKFAADFNDLAGVRLIEDGQYESISHPEKMGNTANIAYGGCAMAVALTAAHASVQLNHRLYSAMGNYLAPALTDRNFSISVKVIRDTITFATRLVELRQTLDNGQARMVLLVIADFQTPEKATLLEYSVPPFLPYQPVDDLLNVNERRQIMVDQKLVHPKTAKMHATVFGLMNRHFETRPHPEGVFSQNLSGMAKNIKTTQDERPLTSKVSGDFVRTHQSLGSHAQNIAALGFFMDGALSFMPLTHSHQFIDDAGACSSLDFALRVFSNDVDMRKWHQREMSTTTGGQGRTYSEGKLWDEEGTLVASMTQQSILRPLVKRKMEASL